ncbi:hypothetical protein ACFL17_06230 [Pseudomonadota bacterium]
MIKNIKYLLILLAVVSTSATSNTHAQKVYKAATRVSNVHIFHLNFLLSFINEDRLEAHIAKKYMEHSKDISDKISLEIVKKLDRKTPEYYRNLKIKVGFRQSSGSTISKKEARGIAKYGLSYVRSQIRLAIKLMNKGRVINT